jgi:excisionase family DNA binding protein
MKQIHAQAAGAADANPDRNEWLTRREIAARLKKSPRTIDTYVRRGYLPGIRVGRSILFRWSEVE